MQAAERAPRFLLSHFPTPSRSLPPALLQLPPPPSPTITRPLHPLTRERLGHVAVGRVAAVGARAAHDVGAQAREQRLVGAGVGAGGARRQQRGRQQRGVLEHVAHALSCCVSWVVLWVGVLVLRAESSVLRFETRTNQVCEPPKHRPLHPPLNLNTCPSTATHTPQDAAPACSAPASAPACAAS